MKKSTKKYIWDVISTMGLLYVVLVVVFKFFMAEKTEWITDSWQISSVDDAYLMALLYVTTLFVMIWVSYLSFVGAMWLMFNLSLAFLAALICTFFGAILFPIYFYIFTPAEQEELFFIKYMDFAFIGFAIYFYYRHFTKIRQEKSKNDNEINYIKN